MRRITAGLLMGTLVLGAMALPAEARGRHHRHHGHDHAHHVQRHVHPSLHHGHHRGHHPGHFTGGFLAGAATVLAVEALHTRPVVPVYYRGPVRRNDWVPGQWEVQVRQNNGFTSYYHVWVNGHWQRHCS